MGKKSKMLKKVMDSRAAAQTANAEEENSPLGNIAGLLSPENIDTMLSQSKAKDEVGQQILEIDTSEIEDEAELATAQILMFSFGARMIQEDRLKYVKMAEEGFLKDLEKNASMQALQQEYNAAQEELESSAPGVAKPDFRGFMRDRYIAQEFLSMAATALHRSVPNNRAYERLCKNIQNDRHSGGLRDFSWVFFHTICPPDFPSYNEPISLDNA